MLGYWLVSKDLGFDSDLDVKTYVGIVAEV